MYGSTSTTSATGTTTGSIALALASYAYATYAAAGSPALYYKGATAGSPAGAAHTYATTGALLL